MAGQLQSPSDSCHERPESIAGVGIGQADAVAVFSPPFCICI